MTRRDRLHVEGDVAGIASLPADDPERIAASEHARGCARCSEALSEAVRVLALVDALPPPALASERLDRLARATTAAIASHGRAHIHVAAAVVGSWAIAFLLAKSRVQSAHAWIGTALALAVALGAALGASRARTLALGSTVGASILLSLATGTSPGFFFVHGLKCIAIELIAAALPYATLVVTTLRRREHASITTFAAVAAAGALAGQAALLFTCPERAHTPHLLATHVTGVALAALAGGFACAPLRAGRRRGRSRS
jgi:hypothetical protein